MPPTKGQRSLLLLNVKVIARGRPDGLSDPPTSELPADRTRPEPSSVTTSHLRLAYVVRANAIRMLAASSTTDKANDLNPRTNHSDGVMIISDPSHDHRTAPPFPRNSL
jgi:hypothetical protein